MTEFTTRFPPSCLLGFTQGDLERYFGAKQDEDHSLWRQLEGQTGVICQGQPGSPCSEPHGFISYVWDVQEWYERKPVSDW